LLPKNLEVALQNKKVELEGCCFLECLEALKQSRKNAMKEITGNEVVK
jgi:hypothetical protein